MTSEKSLPCLLFSLVRLFFFHFFSWHLILAVFSGPLGVGVFLWLSLLSGDILSSVFTSCTLFISAKAFFFLSVDVSLIPYLLPFPPSFFRTTYLLFDSRKKFDLPHPCRLHESVFMNSVISVCLSSLLSLVDIHFQRALPSPPAAL